MSHITKIAAVENATAIWEYDPSLDGNRVLEGSLDVIAAIRTLAIKMRFLVFRSSIKLILAQVQSSGQQIEYFEKLQRECGIPDPLTIPLHSNTRWGTVFNMLDRAHKLRTAINLFIAAADELFGPITTIRKDGRVVKHIPWAPFKLKDVDWARVQDAKAILAVGSLVSDRNS